MKNLKIKLLFALCAILLFSAFITEKKDVITIFMIGDSTMANKSLKNGNLERGWGADASLFSDGGCRSGQSCHEWTEFIEFHQ